VGMVLPQISVTVSSLLLSAFLTTNPCHATTSIAESVNQGGPPTHNN